MADYDAINPEHYKHGGIESIDFIESKNLGFNLGNVVKYIGRAGKKPGVDPIEDLTKAQWYLGREIQRLTRLKNGVQSTNS